MTTSRPDQPATYEGRTLPRPHEELVDQGLQFDMTTLLGRRRLLSLVGLGAGAALIAACSSDSKSSVPATGSEASPSTTSGSTGNAGGSASTTTAGGSASTTTLGTAVAGDPASSDLLEIPDETNGPYPADGTNGLDILEESGVVRGDIRSSFAGASGTADGVPLTFTFNIVDMANGDVPYAGAAVYVWHCDAEGRYSMYSQGAEDENYLRGVQVADNEGNVTFTSIFPACYAGRWPHIHFEVYPDVDSITDHDQAVSTSQAAFPEDACHAVFDNEPLYSASIRNLAVITIDDGIFDSATIDQQMLVLTGDRASGFTGTLVVPVDSRTAQSATMNGPGGGRGPGGSRP